MRSLRLITPLAAALLSAAAVRAQTLPTAPSPPRDIAIRNARIVQAAGRVVEHGTVVLKNGLITAVGANVAIPADAWVIDGAGMTVYPGLVNALSSVGLPASLKLPPRARAGGPGGPGGQAGTPQGQQPPYSWGPEDRPATTPWANAADELNPSEQAVATWRSAGFTTAVVAPERGYFPGQAAVAGLAGERGSDMVVRTPVALRINFNPGPGHRGYPNSLMGVIAYVKQIFSDAAWYDQAWTIYNAAPAGRERPEYDRTLDPLRETLKGRRPVLYHANQAREIDRVFQIAQETNT
ncbi:MAG: amidohydrolase, partial [Gemmatimonadetes bacterium]|nr:amidohydrolase [Gemmatimonadota bacterium]